MPYKILRTFIQCLANRIGARRVGTVGVFLIALMALIFSVGPLFFHVNPSLVETETLQQRHARLRQAMERGDTVEAESLLRGILATDSAAFSRNNYDYLLARLAQDRQEFEDAERFFLQVVNRKASLAGYATWRLAQIARARGSFADEQRLLRRFISEHSDNPLRESAIDRLADSYFKSGNYQKSIEAAQLTPRPRREAQALIGEAQLAMGKVNDARRTFESLLTGDSLDDSSLRASAGLDRIDAASGTKPGQEEALRRAGVYQFNREFAAARRHYLTVINDFPESAKRATVIFQIGRGYFQENNFVEAAKWYDRVHKEFPHTDEGEQGFYFVGHCYQYMGDADRAIARYEAFLKEYPKSHYFGYAHLNAIDTLRSAGRMEEALAWAARAQSGGNEPFIVVGALFQEAKIMLTRGEYSKALNHLAALKSRNLNVRGMTATTNPFEIAFLRAYCLENLGKFEEAINEYLALPELRDGAAGYYGHRASERLRALGSNPRSSAPVTAKRDAFISRARATWDQGEAGAAKSAANQALRFSMDQRTRDEILKILRGAYAKLPEYQLPKIPLQEFGRSAPLASGAGTEPGSSHQAIASALLFLGLYDEGATELLQTTAAKSDYSIALPCSRGNCAHRTVKFSEPLLRALPQDFRPELFPRELAEIFYPFPFRGALTRYASPRGVDPRFVLSIARQETRYNPREKSNAAARGLMQFISSTANQIAAQLGLRDFSQNDLYNPDTAILFGSQYMKNLFGEFGSPQAVAASYNGGEDSVRRWIARAKSSDVDRMVIEIQKSQTKDYVFKVNNYYDAYRAIYPDK